MSLSILSAHAKHRLFERYGKIFTKKDEKSFDRTLQSGKKVIPLGNEKCVCFFQGIWLLFYIENGTVKTFYPPDSLTESEKWQLKNDEVYRKINVDTFNVMLGDWRSPENVVLPKKKRRIPKDVTEHELPADYPRAEELMQRKIGNAACYPAGKRIK